MKLRTPALGILLGSLATSVGAQSGARIVVVLVDDARFQPGETRSTERLLAVLRDEVLTGADLVGVVSTGPSGVATDLHSPADPQRFNDSLRRIVNASPAPAARPVSAGEGNAGNSRHAGHIALTTATEVVQNLAKVRGGSKHFLFVSSADTSAMALEAAITDQTGEIAQDVAALAAAARLANVTVRIVNPGDPAAAEVLRRMK